MKVKTGCVIVLVARCLGVRCQCVQLYLVGKCHVFSERKVLHVH